MREIDKILDSSEKVLWEGVPAFWPYFLPSFGGTLFGIFIIAFTVPFFWAAFFNGAPATFGFVFAIIPGIFALVGLMLLLSPLWAYLGYKNVYYAVTTKRVIFQSGIIGRDFQFVDFDKITNASVDVGALDIITGKRSGSINIMTGSTVIIQTKNGTRTEQMGYCLSHIPDPYDVFKFFKKTEFDVKTDIQYPNALRPKENKGYETDYAPEKKA